MTNAATSEVLRLRNFLKAADAERDHYRNQYDAFVAKARSRAGDAVVEAWLVQLAAERSSSMTAVDDRIRLLAMPSDPDALPVGATGTVKRILNQGREFEQVDVKWDPPNEHRSLMLIPGVDRWEIVT